MHDLCISSCQVWNLGIHAFAMLGVKSGIGGHFEMLKLLKCRAQFQGEGALLAGTVNLAVWSLKVEEQ
jgi:hypothetical protein